MPTLRISNLCIFWLIDKDVCFFRTFWLLLYMLSWSYVLAPCIPHQTGGEWIEISIFLLSGLFPLCDRVLSHASTKHSSSTISRPPILALLLMSDLKWFHAHHGSSQFSTPKIPWFGMTGKVVRKTRGRMWRRRRREGEEAGQQEEWKYEERKERVAVSNIPAWGWKHALLGAPSWT